MCCCCSCGCSSCCSCWPCFRPAAAVTCAPAGLTWMRSATSAAATSASSALAPRQRRSGRCRGQSGGTTLPGWVGGCRDKEGGKVCRGGRRSLSVPTACLPVHVHAGACRAAHARRNNPSCRPALCPRPLRAQVCQLDCREATDLNATQAGWVSPPYAVSSSLSRQPLGYKVGRQLQLARWR